MPQLTHATPKYRKHRASGQAIVTIAGRDHYLGPHRSRASIVEYDRLIAEWLANDRQPILTQDEQVRSCLRRRNTRLSLRVPYLTTASPLVDRFRCGYRKRFAWSRGYRE